MSPELKAFYKSYLDWLEKGAPEGKPYTRQYGLCSGVDRWYQKYVNSEIGWSVFDELENQFKAAGLNSSYPFGSNEYELAQYDATQHLNAKRIAWVKEHAA